jgi:predicted regulator of Ras-like GTPase activity (Roadblock/LC7/MglB family)
MANYVPLLETLTRLRGIRGAMVVATQDGLVVAESLMGGIRGPALAAMAASLTGRVKDLAAGCGFGRPTFFHLQASEGSLLVAPASPELVVVAVAGRDVPLGLLRLEMLRMAERLS